MSEPKPQESTRRSFEMTIEIDAPPEVVWKAISDGQELARWFPAAARVTPPGPDGKGGAVWLSWGEGMEGETPITIWEPLKRLRTASAREDPWSPGEVERQGPIEVAVDYFLEPKAGGEGTVLRLVHSGFGRGAGWDNELDSISSGWKFELRSLKHYLERHWTPQRGGEDRGTVFEMTRAAVPREEGWRLITGERGLCSEGSIAGLGPGSPYRVVTAAGVELRGRVLINNPPRSFAGTVENMDDALVRIEVEPVDDANCGPMAWMSIWGPRRGEAAELARGWRGVLESLFGPRQAYYTNETACGEGETGKGAES